MRPSGSGGDFPFLDLCGPGTAVCRADAHIRLAEQTAFTKIYGEFAASQRADDSVRPQKYTNFTEIFGEFTQSKAPLGLKGPIGVGMLARSA